MNRTLLSVSVTAALALVGVGVLVSQTGSKIGRTPVILHYQTTDKMGNIFTEVIQYRADGSMAQSISLNGDPAQIQVVDLKAKRMFLKDPLTRMYDEAPLTKETAERYAHTPTTCESATSPQAKCQPVGTETIFGQRTQVAKGKLGDSDIVTVYAPDLDYVELIRTRTSPDGKVNFHRQLTGIVLSNPDQSAFESTNYRKVSKPSELISMGQLARGKPDPGADTQNRDGFDKAQLDKRLLDEKNRVN